MSTVRRTYKLREGHKLAEALALLEETPTSAPTLGPTRLFTGCEFSGTHYFVVWEWDYEEASDYLAWYAQVSGDPEANDWVKKWFAVCEHHTLKQEFFTRRK